MAKITYNDKSFLNQNPSIADENKVNDTDLNEIKNVVNTNDDNSTNALNALAGDVLWTNPNPNAVFGSTTITIANKNDYVYFEVFAKNYYLDGYKNSLYTKFENGYNGYLMEIDTEGSLITRRVTNTTNGFTFDNAYYKRYSSTSAATTDNNRAIPLKVIGYKTNPIS